MSRSRAPATKIKPPAIARISTAEPKSGWARSRTTTSPTTASGFSIPNSEVRSWMLKRTA